MAATFLTLPYNYDEKELNQWLGDRELSHQKEHKERWIKAGDALLDKAGHIARVMSISRDRQDRPTILIVSKDLTKEELLQFFDNPVATT